MTNRVLLSISLIALLVLVLLGCTMDRGGAARITSTPTKTSRPLFTSTNKPTVTPLPTNTPLPTASPLAPTDTPAPTETPLPSTATPLLPTEAPPSETPTAPPASPTDTPRPAATNTPAPPTNTPRPQVDFRIVEQDLLPKAENIAGLYTIYVRVEDAAGNPLDGLVVWDPGQPGIEAVTGDKPDYYHAEILMGGGDYYLQVKDFRSERTKRLTTIVTNISHEDLIKAGYCANEAECSQLGYQHFSWQIIFQRTW